MSGSSRASPSGTRPDPQSARAIDALRALADDLAAGRKVAVRLAEGLDEGAYSLAVEAAFEGAPDEGGSVAGSCYRCGSDKLVDGGNGDRLCTACNSLQGA